VIYRQRTEDDGLAYTLIIKLSNTISQEFLLVKKKKLIPNPNDKMMQEFIFLIVKLFSNQFLYL
jgi:hypothetical protein